MKAYLCYGYYGEEEFMDARLLKIFLNEQKAKEFKEETEKDFDKKYEAEVEYHSLFNHCNDQVFLNCPTKDPNYDYETRDADTHLYMRRLDPKYKTIPPAAYIRVSIVEMEAED